MLKILCFSVPRFAPKQRFWASKLNIHCTSQRSNVFDEINRLESQELTSKILNLLNQNDVMNICKYDITQMDAKNIILYRNDKGLYSSLNELLLVKGLNTKILINFFTSVKKNMTKDQKLVKSMKGCKTTPPAPDNLENTTSTILGIHIGLNNISWALLNHKKYEILEWKCKTLQKTALTDIYNPVQQAMEIIREIPESDIYIMEELKLSKTQKNNKNIIIFFQQQQQIISFTSSLATRNMITQRDKTIFTMRPQTSARYFKLLVGSEVISTDYVVPILLGKAKKNVETHSTLPVVYLRNEIQDTYVNQRDSVEKEQMNWALLKALTFAELVIKKTGKT